jgi:hypothetical protein
VDITTLKAQARELELRGNTREALAMYRHALTSLEGTPELLRQLPLYVKAGDLYLKLDNPKAAVSLYETAGKIYAAHGSSKSVSAICAKVVGVMPTRSHVYTRLIRIMLEHGHVAAARTVLLGYAEHAGLHDTRARLEHLADQTEEHLHPVLEMLVEMAERLERAAAPPEAPPRAAPVEITAPEELPDTEVGEPPTADEPEDSPPAAIVEEEEEDEEDEEGEEDVEDGPTTTAAAEGEYPASESEDPGRPVPEPPPNEPFGFAASSDEDLHERDPFGQGLILTDLASEIMASPPAEGQAEEGSRPEPPWQDFDAPATEPERERLGTDASAVEEDGEPLRIDHSATPIPPERTPPPTPSALPAAAAPEPAAPLDEAVPRERVRGDGVDWSSDPGLPGRAARRRSPVGSVLLAAEESRSRKSRAPWYIVGAVVSVLAIIVIVWLLTRGGAAADGGGMDLATDSGSVARDVPLDPAAIASPGAAAEDPPLTLRPDPALSVESLAISPPDTALVGGAAAGPVGGAAPSESAVTVVAIAGLAIEAVNETRIEGRTGYQVLQLLETGERVSILSLATSEPAGPGAQGEVRIDAAPDGTRMARLRVGNHEVEVQGVVSEAAMRNLVVRLAETSTSRE